MAVKTAVEVVFTGIGVERYTPVFQTGIEGALPHARPFSTECSLKVRRLVREQEQAGALPATLTISREGKSLCPQRLPNFL